MLRVLLERRSGVATLSNARDFIAGANVSPLLLQGECRIQAGDAPRLEIDLARDPILPRGKRAAIQAGATGPVWRLAA